MVDQHTYLNATGKVICTGGVFGLEERWRAGQASKAGRPECHQCWTDSLGLRFGDRMEFRYGCLASTWLMTDCHRPDRR